MAYERVNWENLPSTNTPVNAKNLNKMEEGIANAVEKSGDTMTGPLILKKTSYNYNGGTIPGTKGADAHTIEDLINELRYTNGQMGSVEIKTAYTLNNVTIAVGWYNYSYIPHRKGGLDGGADGDNANFGTLMLTGMNISSPVYVLRYNNQNIQELKKLAEQSTGWKNATLSSYIAGTVRYTKIGNIVIVSFSDVYVKSNLSHNKVLASNLPTSTDYIITTLTNFDAPGAMMRIAVNPSGQIVTHYSGNTANNNNYYGTLIYITNQ